MSGLSVLPLIEYGALVLCGTALGFTATTLVAVALLLRRRAPAARFEWPAIVLLRPCQGDDPSLFHNLLSSATAHYDGPRRVLLLLPEIADKAHEIAQAAAAAARELPGAPPVEVRITSIDVETVQNRKVAQLCAALAGPDPAEIIIQADSDVMLDDSSLPGLVAALLADPRCGAAFAAPVEVAPLTLPDRASAALVNASHQSFLALYALSELLGGTPSLAGALCAYRREALDAIGGFPALRRYLGEDYEIARRLRAAGRTIALSPSPARCTDGGRSLREVVGRVSRWMMVVRAQRPGLILSYPFLLAVTPPLFIMSLCLRSGKLGLFASVLLIARAGLALLLRSVQGIAPVGLLPALRDAVLSEILLWLALPLSLGPRRITWRGHRYRIGRGGLLF